MREPVARAVGDGPADQLRLDATNQCVWRGAKEIRLTPKSYAVLCCLLEHPGQLVSKDDLLDAVWPDGDGERRVAQGVRARDSPRPR